MLLLDENLSRRLVMGNCSNARVLAALCDRHAAIMEILSGGRPVGVIELG